MPGLLAPSHIIILGLVLLLIFGPKRLPEMGGSLGHGMREFKNSVAGEHEGEPRALASTDQAVASNRTASPRATWLPDAAAASPRA